MPIFGKKTESKLLTQAESQPLANSYNREFWQRFQKNRLAKWSVRVLYFLVFIAVFGDFIANDRPLYCEYEGKNYFPVYHSYLEDFFSNQAIRSFFK